MKYAVMNMIAAAGVCSLVFGSVTAQAASAEVRAKKNIGVGASISNATGVGSGVGLNAYYNVNKRVQFGIGIASSSWDGTEYMELQQEEKYKKDSEIANGGYTIRDASYNATVVAAESRVFLGNSFNISASVGSRSVRGEYVVSSESDATGDRETTYRSRGLLSNVAIANDFTFDNGATLGVDWVGITTGMSNKSETEANDAASTSTGLSAARNDMKRFTDKRLDGSTLYILGARLGWMF